MTLLDARRGWPLRIVRIADDRARAQCTMVGLGEGAVVESAETLPLGPVLVCLRDQEVCLGRALARRIHIEPEGSPPPDLPELADPRGSAHAAELADLPDAPARLESGASAAPRRRRWGAWWRRGREARA